MPSGDVQNYSNGLPNGRTLERSLRNGIQIYSYALPQFERILFLKLTTVVSGPICTAHMARTVLSLQQLHYQRKLQAKQYEYECEYEDECVFAVDDTKYASEERVI